MQSDIYPHPPRGQHFTSKHLPQQEKYQTTDSVLSGENVPPKDRTRSSKFKEKIQMI